MGQIEVLPPTPSKSEPVAATKSLFNRPAGYVPYVPPPIPGVVPASTQEVAAPEPTAIDVPAAKLQAYLSTEPGWWDSFWRDRARNKLQRTLARIIQISQDHEANGVKPGDPIYQALYAKALQLCYWYFDKWHLDRDHIEIEIPCMRQLRLAALPESAVTTHKTPVAVFGLIAVVALPLVIGAWCGLFAVGQRWIMHLFGG
jgi:hypothetical protein